MTNISSEKPAEESDDKATSQQKKTKQPEHELSEEDKLKLQEVEELIQNVQCDDSEVAEKALTAIIDELSTATNSIVTVPKAVKFYRSFYEALAKFYTSLSESSDFKTKLSDVLFILSATFDVDGCSSVVKYYSDGSGSILRKLGFEYTQRLARDIYAKKDSTDAELKALQERVALNIFPIFVEHNAECEAADLLDAFDKLSVLVDYVDATSCQRLVPYILGLASLNPSKSVERFKAGYNCLMRHKRYPEALRVAIKMKDVQLAQAVVDTCEDPLCRKQLAFFCSRHRIGVSFESNEELEKLASGELLSEQFLYVAKELDVVETKFAEDVYKRHLEDPRKLKKSSNSDADNGNLAAILVNAFVNAGFCSKDVFNNNSFRYSQNDTMILVASVGALLLWNPMEGLNSIDLFQYGRDSPKRAGALIACGLIHANITNESDAAFALLRDELETPDKLSNFGAIVGLGFAYAGTNREDILEVLVPFVIDSSFNTETSGAAALTLGLVCVGTCNEYAIEAIEQAIIDRSKEESQKCVDYALGLGLVVLGSDSSCSDLLCRLKKLNTPMAKYAAWTVKGMAAAGTCDTSVIREMMQKCSKSSKNPSDEKSTKNVTSHTAAVLSLPLIALGDGVGQDMILRILDHISNYGSEEERRAVPLALALHSASNANPVVIETLYKLCHGSDPGLATQAIFALGIVGAGTNNAKIAEILRHLVPLFRSNPDTTFMIRLSQGLLHMGKGLLSLSPLHSDRFLIHPVALAGLLIALHFHINKDTGIHFKRQYIFLYLMLAIFPRMLLTVDEDLTPLAVSVHVGQAVDTVAQAGQPKAVKGFQTYTTPVLLSPNEKAELTNDEYIPMTPILEGVVILRKNPEYSGVTTEQ